MTNFPTKRVRNYVYVVLEHASQQRSVSLYTDAVVHGVYINKEEADGKKTSLIIKSIISGSPRSGYICILKKPLHGKSV